LEFLSAPPALGYELWRQLNGFPPNLPPKAVQASGVKKKKLK
jgi:hypothetical protein